MFRIIGNDRADADAHLATVCNIISLGSLRYRSTSTSTIRVRRPMRGPLFIPCLSFVGGFACIAVVVVISFLFASLKNKF